MHTICIDPVYIMAKDSRFIANPGCFDVGFVLPFTLRNMNDIKITAVRASMSSELSNPEYFMGSMYRRHFESDKRFVISFREEFE